LARRTSSRQKVVKKLFIGDYWVFSESAVGKVPDAFPNRDAKKAFFTRLGVDNMKENDRIVFYQDATQALLLRGSVDDKGNIVLKESIDLTPKERNPLNAGRSIFDQFILGDVKFKPMKQSISIPKDLNNETERKLRSEITLFALADKAMQSQVASTSNVGLPHNGNNSNQLQI
jgi:hypothetical protein